MWHRLTFLVVRLTFTIMKRIPKPKPEEYAVYYNRYIDTISEDTHILKALKEESKEFEKQLLSLSEGKLHYRYAPGKWSIKDILMHLIDCERIFLYRALRFSRNDQTPLPFFEEDQYAMVAEADKLSIRKIVKEYKTQRAATLAFFDNQTQKSLKRTGIASQAAMSVRACAWIICAHERHHRKIMEERYLGSE